MVSANTDSLVGDAADAVLPKPEPVPAAPEQAEKAAVPTTLLAAQAQQALGHASPAPLSTETTAPSSAPVQRVLPESPSIALIAALKPLATAAAADEVATGAAPAPATAIALAMPRAGASPTALTPTSQQSHIPPVNMAMKLGRDVVLVQVGLRETPSYKQGPKQQCEVNSFFECAFNDTDGSLQPAPTSTSTGTSMGCTLNPSVMPLKS